MINRNSKASKELETLCTARNANVELVGCIDRNNS